MKSFALAMLAASVSAAGDFVYDYNQLGADWGSIEGAEVCGTGTSQSPIDLPTDAPILDASSLIDSGVDADWFTVAEENFVITTETISNPDVQVGTHAVKVIYNENNDVLTTTVADWSTGETNNWYLKQFHFHTKSEHTIDSVQYDLEVHFVHFNTDDDNWTNALVLGVIFDASQDIADPLLEQFDWTTNPGAPTIEVLDLQGWLNGLDLSSRWNYQGSLTTPPCNEVVNWNVLTTVLPMSQAQLDTYISTMGDGFIGNARETLPLNDRTLNIINSNDIVVGLEDAGYEAASLLSLSAFAMASTFAVLN